MTDNGKISNKTEFKVYMTINNIHISFCIVSGSVVTEYKTIQTNKKLLDFIKKKTVKKI